MNEPMKKIHKESSIVRILVDGIYAGDLFDATDPSYKDERIKEIVQFIVVGDFIFAEILYCD